MQYVGQRQPSGQMKAPAMADRTAADIPAIQKKQKFRSLFPLYRISHVNGIAELMDPFQVFRFPAVA